MKSCKPRRLKVQIIHPWACCWPTIAANQSAKERDIKKELSQIKVILATGLTPQGNENKGKGGSSASDGGGSHAFADILKAAEEEDARKKAQEEKERQEKELDEKKKKI